VTSLIAIFSYNRGQLLANCVRSVERFYPDANMVVFDDRSEDPATTAVLDDLRSRGHEIVVAPEPEPGKRFGGLYENINASFDLARERGIRFVHLVQDDTQFVWRAAALDDEVAAIFDAHPDALQVQAHFWKQLGTSQGEVLDDPRAYRMELLGAMGFVDVDRAHAGGFRFERSEKESGLHAASLGFHAYSLPNPVVARVPWPKNARYREVTGGEKQGGRELLVKPLDDTTIARLTGRELEARPRGEEYYVPWGWRCWSPYPISPTYKSWLKGLVVVAMKRRSVRGLIPRRVGDTA
jgi:hypothetical protein